MLISGVFKLIQRIFAHFFFSGQTGAGAKSKTYAFDMSLGIEKT